MKKTEEPEGGGQIRLLETEKPNKNCLKPKTTVNFVLTESRNKIPHWQTFGRLTLKNLSLYSFFRGKPKNTDSQFMDPHFAGLGPQTYGPSTDTSTDQPQNKIN